MTIEMICSKVRSFPYAVCQFANSTWRPKCLKYGFIR
jgi:hypothetical protein